MTTLEILTKFTTDKKLEEDQGHSYYPGNKQTFYNRLGANTYDEIMQFEQNPNMHPDMIPVELWNKQFTVGDFTVIVQYNKSAGFMDKRGNTVAYISYGQQWNVVLCYHGVYLLLYKYVVSNVFNIRGQKDDTYNFTELETKRDYSGYTLTKALLRSLDTSKLELSDQTLDLAEPNFYHQTEVDGLHSYSHKSKIKSLDKYTAEEIDLEWFVSSEIKKGVYTPEPVTIRRFLFAFRSTYAFDKDVSKLVKSPKDLLHKLGIKKVQLRSDAHFDLTDLFDLTGITVKAPAKVIETYGYQDLCEDKAMLAKIEADKQQAQRERELQKYNRQFTLVQHGKTLLEDVDLEKIQDYLASFISNKTNYEDAILKAVKPIFDAYPEIDRWVLATWGTYHKYECRGEQYFNTDDMNSHIDDELLDSIHKLYETPSIDEEATVIKYGRESQGGTKLVVVKDKKGKLQLVTEDYDPE